MMVLLKTAKFLTCTALCSTLFVSAAVAKGYPTNMARMQAMDKITGRVSEIDVPVNGEVQFGSFSIVVRKCVTRPPEETPENTAFVDVVDNYSGEDPVNIFKGWMFSSSPALNAVEHPIYDVWLLRCYDGDLKGRKLLSTAELSARDDIPKAVRKESPLKKDIDLQETLTDQNVDIPQEQQPQEAVNEPETPADDAPIEVSADVSFVEFPVQEEGAPKPLLQLPASDNQSEKLNTEGQERPDENEDLSSVTTEDPSPVLSDSPETESEAEDIEFDDDIEDD